MFIGLKDFAISPKIGPGLPFWPSGSQAVSLCFRNELWYCHSNSDL